MGFSSYIEVAEAETTAQDAVDFFNGEGVYHTPYKKDGYYYVAGDMFGERELLEKSWDIMCRNIGKELHRKEEQIVAGAIRLLKPERYKRGYQGITIGEEEGRPVVKFVL